MGTGTMSTIHLHNPDRLAAARVGATLARRLLDWTPFTTTWTTLTSMLIRTSNFGRI